MQLVATQPPETSTCFLLFQTGSGAAQNGNDTASTMCRWWFFPCILLNQPQARLPMARIGCGTYLHIAAHPVHLTCTAEAQFTVASLPLKSLRLRRSLTGRRGATSLWVAVSETVPRLIDQLSLVQLALVRLAVVQAPQYQTK